MHRALARAIEKAWIDGQLHGASTIDAFARQTLAQLSNAFPRQLGRRDRALTELTRDIHRTLRTLTYGGRRPDSVHPARVAALT